MRRLSLALAAWRAFAKGREGTGAVEFALCAPILFTVIFWTIEAGKAVHARNSFENAVAESARLIYLEPDADSQARDTA